MCKSSDISLILVLAFLIITLTGCSTAPKVSDNPGDTADPDTQPMVAVEAYRDSSEFYVKLKQQENILYAGGNWDAWVNLGQDPLDSQNEYSTPKLIPIQYYQSYPWKALPQEAEPLLILGVKKWRLLRDRIFSRILPRDKSGVVMNFEYEEYFLFYDQEQKFQAVRLADKPSDYAINSYIHFEKFVDAAGKIMEDFLHEHDIQHKEFIFNTGDEGLYSLPFLYVNTERYLLVFVRNVPQQPVAMITTPGIKGVQAAGHVMRSHLGNLYTRPVSSLFRLVSVITDTAVATASFEWAAGVGKQPVPPLANKKPMDLQAWENDLDDITRYPLSEGSVEFLVDGEEFFTRFIDELTTAERSIHLQTYIFDNDDYALQIADLLKRRSNEGIEVKVLLDGLGTITATMEDSDSQPDFHKPPASVSRYLEKGSEVRVRQKANPWLTGDHVKSIIIDQDTAFVGGMNIGREYRYDWHDLMMELRGPVIDLLSEEFNKSWNHAGPLGDFGWLFSRFNKNDRTDSLKAMPELRVLLTSPGNYEIYNAQLEAIRRAQSYIYVQNAYFTNDRLLRELVKARRRGVDVRVVIPLETDHGPITRSHVLAVNLMLENGIRVFVYPGFSHVKAAVYDGWVCVGSANFDRLSLRINRELNIASSSPSIAQQLVDKLFAPDFKASPELTEPLPERWVDKIIEVVGDYVF